jgi:hypothetical protein
MDIVKNNIVSIILGVIALVALSTPFWLLPGYQEDLEKKAQASQSNYTQVNSLLTKQRTQPGVDIQGQPKPLERYPNQATIDAGQTLQKEVARSAEDMHGAAVEINRGSMAVEGAPVLLVPDALPRPRNQADFVFRDQYIRLVREGLLSRQVLQGGMPPTKEEVDAEREKLKTQIFAKLRTFPGGQTNQAELEAEFATAAAKLTARLIDKRADELKCYVDPTAFTWHAIAQLAGGQPPDPVQIWQAQLGLWMQTSFARAIADVNKPARNVRDAVVKRLLRIEFADNPYQLPAPPPGASTGGGEAGVPLPPTAEGDPAAPLPKDFTRSITGRVSNPLFDVVHFRALLHVDHARLPLFLQELGRNRLMYVRSMQVTAVDPAAMQLMGYTYGTSPTVEVALDMEMLFMRAWTRDLMPDPVRITLGIPPREPIAPGMGGSGGMTGMGGMGGSRRNPYEQ